MQASTVLRANVFMRLRAGDQGAGREVVGAIERGVRILVARRLDGLKLRDAIADVHRQVLRAIVDGRIGTPEELPGLVRTSVQLQAATRTMRAPAPHSQAVKNLQEAVSARELEVLHRYYVLGESTCRISEMIGMTIAAIHGVRQRARQAFQQAAFDDVSALVPSGCFA